MLRRIRNAQLLMDTACEIAGRPINIMEVCGTHTVSIFRNGIRGTLPKTIKLLPGPGCPEPFYLGLGFRHTGRMDGSEIVLEHRFGEDAE